MFQNLALGPQNPLPGTSGAPFAVPKAGPFFVCACSKPPGLRLALLWVGFSPPSVWGCQILQSAIAPRPLRLPPGVPNPTDYRETPCSAQSQQTTGRLPGVPNPTDYPETPWSAQSQQYRETPWSAQTVSLPGVPNPNRLPRDSLECPTPETTMRLPGRVGMFEVKIFFWWWCSCCGRCCCCWWWWWRWCCYCCWWCWLSAHLYNLFNWLLKKFGQPEGRNMCGSVFVVPLKLRGRAAKYRASLALRNILAAHCKTSTGYSTNIRR